MFPLCVLQLGDFKAAQTASCCGHSCKSSTLPKEMIAKHQKPSTAACWDCFLLLFITYSLCHLFQAPCSEHCCTWFYSMTVNLALWNWVFLQHTPQPLPLTEARKLQGNYSKLCTYFCAATTHNCLTQRLHLGRLSMGILYFLEPLCQIWIITYQYASLQIRAICQGFHSSSPCIPQQVIQ